MYVKLNIKTTFHYHIRGNIKIQLYFLLHKCRSYIHTNFYSRKKYLFLMHLLNNTNKSTAFHTISIIFLTIFELGLLNYIIIV